MNAFFKRGREITENIALAWLYAHFAMSHVALMRFSGQYLDTLPFVVLESLTAVLFLFRRPSYNTSKSPEAWVAGIVGTFTPLMIRGTVAEPISETLALGLELVGITIACAGLASLGRSIGIVAADRGLRTRGMYRVVRHPMYAGHLLTLTGYVLMAPSWRNLLLVLTTIGAMLVRIYAEEKVLSESNLYRVYSKDVKWRLVPYVV